LLICFGACVAVIIGVTDSGARPPLTAVLAIVIAGLAFTGFIFHCLRLKPALQLAGKPIPDDVIQAHLDEITKDTLYPPNAEMRGN
jgi:hypothetical protein